MNLLYIQHYYINIIIFNTHKIISADRTV